MTRNSAVGAVKAILVCLNSLKMILFGGVLILLPVLSLQSDGAYFSGRSVAVSADQKAIIIKIGDQISITFSTGYSGDGAEFSWVIPSPVPPEMDGIFESGEEGTRAFAALDEITAPEVYTSSGCFPAGTTILTSSGPRAIETVEPGTEVYAWDARSKEWTVADVLRQEQYSYEGDIVSIQLGDIEIEVTGNHSFFVVRGDRLSSRPLPREIPEREQRSAEPGRWVEARELVKGDRLKVLNGEELGITGLKSRMDREVVHHLQVETYHTFAVHSAGVLVHNGGKAEKSAASGHSTLVTVYGTLTLENYEVTVLGAAAASSLLNWLGENDYHVSSQAADVIDTYIAGGWSFIAVKLKPGVQRRYENEFLPPLTVQYRHGELIFPLRISSVSTAATAKVTLYVISESPVTSSNFPTADLKYEDHVTEWVDPEQILESAIQGTVGDEKQGLAVTYRGLVSRLPDFRHIIGTLMKTSSLSNRPGYLTRFEARMTSDSMNDDIHLALDPAAEPFRVRIEAAAGWGSELILAAQNGQTDTVEELLNAGANLHATDSAGNTALIAAASGGHTGIVRILLEAGSDIDAKGEHGDTVLIAAANGGHLQTVRLLVKEGAALNQIDDHGGTALVSASANGRINIVRMLLAAGAEVQPATGAVSALVRASYNGHAETVRVLLEAGASVDIRDKFSKHTALTAASFQGRFDILQTLLAAGADVDARGRNEWTALMHAAFRGYLEIVTSLIEAGADINARDKRGWTALFCANKEGHTQIADLLVASGAEKW